MQMTDLRNKSPLKILEEKNFKSARTLAKLFPPSCIVNCFLFYDGNIELGLMKDNRFVVARTDNYCVYEFWRCMQADPIRVNSFIDYLVPVEQLAMFEIWQEKFAEFEDPFVRSAFLYILNQCSSTGYATTGALAEKEPSPISRTVLRGFDPDRFYIKFDEPNDLKGAIESVDDDEFIYIPAGRFNNNFFEEGKSLAFDHSNIMHKELAEIFNNSSKKMAILYKQHSGLSRLYDNAKFTMFDKYGNVTGQKDRCVEVAIANF
jgi:site-specific DNA-adenine methylase